MDKWTVRPYGKTDAPSGPSMGFFLRHIDFLSANGARARPWQNTDNVMIFWYFNKTCDKDSDEPVQVCILNTALMAQVCQASDRD